MKPSLMSLQVLICVGETGSGKTTQLTQHLMLEIHAMSNLVQLIALLPFWLKLRL